ncbi:hypothetical protein LIP_2203 [Limnochorda pilosa]|uniref:ABC transmembrane type-1 domain-containing protein n=1 Tax=Limnochorda pilosa TaxID=1555112 RepID=A0A0K2SMI9_LIMPI|nr:hypothetical protein LIP_2203 [Limnochorda pilosa]
MRSNWRQAAPWVLPAVVVLFVITILPTLFLFYTSLHHWELGYPWEAREFAGLVNFVDLWSDRQFLQSLRTTAIYVVSTVGVELILGFALALFLSQRRLWGKGVLVATLVIPMTVTPSIAGLIWRLYFNPNYGMVNYFMGTLAGVEPNWYGADLALASVVLVDIWQWTPFVALILLAGLSALPRTPYEAALVDGASGWATLRYITLPLLRPIILVALILRSMDSLKMFDVVFSLTGGGPGNATEVLSMQVYRTGFYQTGWVGYASAMAMILLVVIILVSQLFVRVLGSRREVEGV